MKFKITQTSENDLNGLNFLNALNSAFSSRADEAAVDNDDLAGDEAIVQDQAEHAVGDVVFGATAFERRVFGAPVHQPLVVFR